MFDFRDFIPALLTCTIDIYYIIPLLMPFTVGVDDTAQGKHIWINFLHSSLLRTDKHEIWFGGEQSKQSYEDEHNCQRTNHSWWRAHKGGGVLRLSGKCGWPSGRHRSRRHSQNRQGKSSFCHAQKHLAIWRNQHENQTPHLQLQCEVSPALRMWDMANNTDDATKDPDILQHLSEAHLQNPMAREDPKWRTVGASGTGTSGQADTAEEVGLDRTHPQEASIQHHTPSPDLEPAGEEEERPASQQLEARHWSRAETAGDQLVLNDKSSPEQSAMAGGRWWPMLHWERWA